MVHVILKSAMGTIIIHMQSFYRAYTMDIHKAVANLQVPVPELDYQRCSVSIHACAVEQMAVSRQRHNGEIYKPNGLKEHPLKLQRKIL